MLEVEVIWPYRFGRKVMVTGDISSCKWAILNARSLNKGKSWWLLDVDYFSKCKRGGKSKQARLRQFSNRRRKLFGKRGQKFKVCVSAFGSVVNRERFLTFAKHLFLLVKTNIKQTVVSVCLMSGVIRARLTQWLQAARYDDEQERLIISYSFLLSSICRIREGLVGNMFLEGKKTSLYSYRVRIKV